MKVENWEKHWLIFFRNLDLHTICSNSSGGCYSLEDQVHIVIEGTQAAAEISTNTLRIGRDIIELARAGGEDLSIAASVIGHEIKHFQQGFLSVGSVLAEAEAYEVQYDLQVAMGIDHSDPDNIGRHYVDGVKEAALLVDASNYELMNSGLAATYSDLPLWGGAWWVIDEPLRDFIGWWHDIWN